jgi:hypothetical protein
MADRGWKRRFDADGLATRAGGDTMGHEVFPLTALFVMLGLLASVVGTLLFKTFRLLYEGERAPKASLLVGNLAAAYGLLIFAFAGIYRVIFHFDPHSFFFSNVPKFDETAVTTFYFSIATITSTGYGDIHPQSDIAMAVAMVEMLCGYFMTVIFFSVIAGLAFKKAGRSE